MPLMYTAKLDGSNATRYFHISLVGFYLDQAHKNATKSKIKDDDTLSLVYCVTGIIFSAMSLEAFANEVAEDAIPKDELNDFNHLRKRYRKNKGESSVSAKFRILFKLKHKHDIESDIEDKISELISLRNNLVHYKLTELAGKFIMPPPTQTKCEDGTYLVTADFMVQPERIERPFIQKINSESTIKSFNTALLVINKWGALSGNPDIVKDVQKIA